MTKDERKRVAAFVKSAEYLFLENLALKLVLEHRGVSNWEKLSDKLIRDPEILAGVHLKFQDLYGEIARSEDPSKAMEAFLPSLPKASKPH
jgi:hypothetical protein